MKRNLIISLFDYSGHMVHPWASNKFDTLILDKAHPPILAKIGYNRYCFGGDYTEIYKALFLGKWTREDIAFVFAFPPCTDLAGSGARWWQSKQEKDPDFQLKAMKAVKFAEHLAHHAGCGYMIENPVGVIPRYWRKWDHKFHPHQFTGYCKEDNYNKTTCLWTDGFVMPDDNVDQTLGKPDNRIHMMSGGKDQKRKRSFTPMGFAWAVFFANHENIRRRNRRWQARCANRLH